MRGSSARRACSSARPCYGWHGKPPERGEESTLFVEGRNFSVHDTHVIAGGKAAKSVLISRNLLEVTIAKDASPMPSADGTPLLDINVATPNGVSNHLLINMAHPEPRTGAARAISARSRRRKRSRAPGKAPPTRTDRLPRNRPCRRSFDSSKFRD